MPVLKNFSPKVLSKIKSFELCSLYNMRGSSSLDVWSKSSNPYLRKQSDSQNTKVYTLVFLSLYFHHISSWPVSPDCPWCKGSHSSIASLLTLCLSMSLWGGMWESILGQAVFMWTIIWHLHDMQRSSYIWGGFHTKMLGDYNGLKVHIFCSMLVRAGKFLEIIYSPAGSNVSILLVTSWPVVLTREGAEAIFLTLRRVPLFSFGSWRAA